MGLPWIKLHTEMPDHPKVEWLASAVGLNADEALGIVVRLWTWTARFCADGIISIPSGGRPVDVQKTSKVRPVDVQETSVAVHAIETGCRWKGEPGRLVNGLVSVGLLDAIDGGYEVHNWEVHAKEHKKKHEDKQKEAARGRARRAEEKAAREALKASTGRPVDVHPLEIELERELELEKKEASSPYGDSSPCAGEAVQPRAAKPTGPTPDDLMALWNAEAHSALARCLKLTEPRRRAAKARLADRPDLGEWREVVRRIGASSFCRGEDGGWRADFDWLVKPDTAIRVMEGKYDRSGPARISPLILTKEDNAKLSEVRIRGL